MTDTCSCLFIVMYSESTLLCNPYYLKSCGCGCSEMSLSSSLLRLRLTVINAHFVWAAAARTVWPRRGALNAHWPTRPSVTAGSGRWGGRDREPPWKTVRPCWWAEPRRSRLDTRLRAPLSPLVAPGDQSAAPRLAENTAAYTCRLYTAEEAGRLAGGGGGDGGGGKRHRAAVCHRPGLGEPRAGTARREDPLNASQRSGTVSSYFCTLEASIPLAKENMWWRVMLWRCAGEAGGGGTHVRARTPRHTFSAVCTVLRGCRLVHWLLLSINNAFVCIVLKQWQ